MKKLLSKNKLGIGIFLGTLGLGFIVIGFTGEFWAAIVGLVAFIVGVALIASPRVREVE